MYNKKRSLSPLAYRGHCTPFYTLVIPYVFSSTVKKSFFHQRSFSFIKNYVQDYTRAKMNSPSPEILTLPLPASIKAVSPLFRLRLSSLQLSERFPSSKTIEPKLLSLSVLCWIRDNEDNCVPFEYSFYRHRYDMFEFTMFALRRWKVVKIHNLFIQSLSCYCCIFFPS